MREAFVCPKADCNYRGFGAGWVCPEHGGAELQANNPYFGRSTAEGPASRLSDVELEEYRAG